MSDETFMMGDEECQHNPKGFPELTLRQQIKNVRATIQKEQKILNELLNQCPHNIVKHNITEDCAIARCDICNKGFRWWCPKSKDHLCDYTEDFDSCDYCGQPEERK